jgi:undecaprenyl diphosphate synthase
LKLATERLAVTLVVDNKWGDETRPGPSHVAIIMDGNGRWAAERRLPRVEGHRRGVEAVRRVVEASRDLGVTHLTLFSFSSENWSRPAKEISDLFGLLRRFIRRDLADLHKNGVRIRIIGSRGGFDADIQRMLDDAVELTKDNGTLHLTIAFNYGSRNEIMRAAERFAEDIKAGVRAPGDMTEDLFGVYLDTDELPDPDLLIRTSGELRLSNFLLWQLAYAEFVFVDTYWPDFDKADYEEALAEFRRRNRRFGGRSVRSMA